MPEPAPLILLVDDDPDFTEINRRVLEAGGYRVAVSHDPAEAWRTIESEPPALVITDLMMSDLDSGFAFSRQLKADPRTKETPVIIVTSVSSQMGFDFRPRTADDLAAMHVDAYFDKPAPAKALLEKIASLLSRRS
jgi:CheY-like chemotaxis protein